MGTLSKVQKNFCQSSEIVSLCHVNLGCLKVLCYQAHLSKIPLSCPT